MQSAFPIRGVSIFTCWHLRCPKAIPPVEALIMPNRPRKPTSDVSARAHVATPPTSRVPVGARQPVVAPKLNALQLAELLRPFWVELLQNNLKNVRKFLRENRSRIDFNAARYTPCADGTGLHLCAQHGFIPCAKLLLDSGVKIDLQNKVGSTALHVACKFNQEEMVLFLLETGARMDVPDMRNNAAFDVAPYSLLDNCMLAPQRAKLAAEQEEEARLLEIQQTAVAQSEDATLAKAHASMLLIDWESRAWEEWQALQATNRLDREWSEQVQRSKDILEIKRAMFTDLQVQRQKEENEIAQTWKNIFRDARDRQQRAREELERMLLLTEETHQRWMQEQQALWDQCGLIEAAEEFPNDADVQHWVLDTILALIDQEASGCVPVNPHGELVTTDINQLLVREEIVFVLRNVLLRFPTVRDLQLSAVRCLVGLVRHCVASTSTCSRTSSFLASLINANVMAVSRDALFQFKQDAELAHSVVELLYHLLSFRGDSGAHALQFCQNRFSRQLPLHILRLHETSLPVLADVESPQNSAILASPEALLTARHHTSFLLFTLTKYNVRKMLDKCGALPVVRRLILELTKSSSRDSITDEVRASTLRYLLGSLALMHSPGNNAASPRQRASVSWTVDELSQILSAIRPWLLASLIENEPPSSVHRSLSFWAVKLIRSLTQTGEDDVVQLRTWLRTREHFDLFAGLALAVRRYNLEQGDDTATQNIVVVWLELVEDIWLCRYNSDGQLAATAVFILDFLLRLLELQAHPTEEQERSIALVNIPAVFRLIALVLSNGKNMRYLLDHEYKIDMATLTILSKLLGSKREVQDNEIVFEAATLELLAHILRVYLRFFDYAREHIKSDANLHDRCRAIGLCAALRAFGLSNSDTVSTSRENLRSTQPIANMNQQNAETTAVPKLKSKMQLARAWSRSNEQPKAKSSHSPERETLYALTRALLRHAPCDCNDY